MHYNNIKITNVECRPTSVKLKLKLIKKITCLSKRSKKKSHFMNENENKEIK